MNNLTIAGMLCGAFSLFCCTGAIASPRWVGADLNSEEVYFGMWKQGSKAYETGREKHGFFDIHTGWTIATILLEMGGLFLIFADVILAIKHIFFPRCNHDAGKGTGLYAITGGLIIAIGAIVWAAKYTDVQALAMCHLSAGFSLAILSAVMSIIAGSMLLLGWRDETREHSYTTI